MKFFNLHKLFAIVALLCTTFVGKAVAETTATLQTSSTAPSSGKPEHVYTINNMNVNGSTNDFGYWNENLYAVVNNTDNSSGARFAFYAVSGKSNAYYIYNYTASKWVTYTPATSYDNKKGFLTLSDTKNESCYFDITQCTNSSNTGYQMRPYASNGTIDEDRYLNFNGGNGANTSFTVGLWQDSGSADKGACWILKEVVFSNIVASTNEAKPEHVYNMHSAQNDYVNTNLYRVTTADEGALFAFFAVSGKTDVYYIYNYSAQKWLTHTLSSSYTKGKDFVSNGEKTARREFYITATSKDGVNGVQIQPYTSSGTVAANYLNFYGGGGANVANTIGNYTTGGSGDAGSLWIFTEVENATTKAVVTSTTLAIGTATNLTYKGNTTWKATKNTAWEVATDIDWDTQKLEVTIDLNGVYAADNQSSRCILCVCGSDGSIGWVDNSANSIYFNYSATQVQGYVLEGNKYNTGYITYNTNPVVFEYSKAKGLTINGVQKHNATQLATLLSKSSIKIGSTNEAASATYTIRVLSLDYAESETIIGNSIREDATNTFSAQEGVEVSLKRTLSSEYWNTFCVPFDIDAATITDMFGADAKVRTFDSMNGTVMNFAPSATIEAGKPYLVKPAQDVVDPTFTDVNIQTTDPQRVGADGYYMQGVFGVKTDLTVDGTNLFLGDGDKFYKPAGETSAKMKGMRAFFIVPSGTNYSAMRANIDGSTTALDEIDVDVEQSTDRRIYNLQGQFVGTRLEGLHGVYVQNGKKILVK